MKPSAVLSVVALAILGGPTKGHADTKLLWRTPTPGVTIVPNNQGRLIELGKVDVSAYDRLRFVAIARRPTGLAQTAGFGLPFRIELHIGEGSDDLGLLENGYFPLN